MNARIYRLLVAVLAGALLAFLGGQSLVAAKAAPSVTPSEGVPGVVFTFRMDGFKGAVPAEDADDGQGEEIDYWANLPDGSIIDTEPRSGTNDRGSDTKPLIAHANGHGAATVRWAAPEDAMPGRYTMVFHGRQSGHEVSIPFEMHPDGWQTVEQTNVTPRTGSAGTEFTFIATGYEGAPTNRDNNDSHGEKVAYWFNTPSGAVIGTEARTDSSDNGNDTKPLLHFADGRGVVSISWTAPADLEPGAYSIVIHGLSSHREVLIKFAIK